MRSRVQRALVVTLSLGATLIGLEAGFRLARWHRLTLPKLEDDPTYHHRLKPNWTFHQASPDFQTIATTNNLGLRGPRSYGPKPAGVRRLLMLGDSFTFGVGVNDAETFCALLQQALDQQGTPIEVINAGLGGYSPLLHYIALRGLYLPLQPDAVILWFDFGDLHESFFYERNLRYDAQGHILGCDPNYQDGRFNWSRYVIIHSALAKYFHNKVIRTYQKLRILGFKRYLQAALRGERAKALIAKLKPSERHGVEPLQYDQLFMIRDVANLPQIRAHWERRTGRNILMIRDLLRERGIPFALATYPYGVQVGPDEWDRGRKAFGFEPGTTYNDRFPFEFLEMFAETNQIPFIRARRAFAEAPPEEILFHHWDGHFTAAGHQAIATYLWHDPVFLALLDRLQPTPASFSPDHAPHQGSPLLHDAPSPLVPR